MCKLLNYFSLYKSIHTFKVFIFLEKTPSKLGSRFVFKKCTKFPNFWIYKWQFSKVLEKQLLSRKTLQILCFVCLFLETKFMFFQTLMIQTLGTNFKFLQFLTVSLSYKLLPWKTCHTTSTSASYLKYYYKLGYLSNICILLGVRKFPATFHLLLFYKRLTTSILTTTGPDLQKLLVWY